VLQISKTCTLLGTLLLGFAFPAWTQSHVGNNPQITVSVYDDAGVSERTLIQAEQKTARVFEIAGLDVIWQNCSTATTRHLGPDAPAGRVRAPAPTWSDSECGRFEWPTRLAVRIVPKSNWTNEVFGAAFLSAKGTGCYTDVFYQSAVELHSAWNVDLSDILGSVMAHELGHLLLGSNSHAPTGIMRARWQGEELGRAARGSLLFTAEQSEHMRAKLVATRAPLAVTARASY
jgi:hypothetical protein